MADDGTLGCASEYTILAIVEVGNFGQSVGELTGFTSVQWNRRMDETSEATVTIPVTPGCCELLGSLRTWHHGIVIYRDGMQVWDGPIVQIQHSPGSVQILAQDVTALLSKRWLPRDLCFSPDPAICNTGNPQTSFGLRSPEFVAGTLIAEALGTVDAHGGFARILSESTEQYEAFFKEFGGPAYELLQSLAQNYLSFTALGRSILIFPAGVSVGTTAPLVCDDFYSDGFSAIENGLSAATQVALIAGDSVSGSTATTNIGVAGGIDPYYGLLQVVRDGNNVVSNDSFPSPEALAQAALNAIASPPPVILSTNGSRLTTTAPVTIEQLVPGTLVPVVADCFCSPVSGTFVLSALSVTFGADGETVEPTLLSPAPGLES